MLKKLFSLFVLCVFLRLTGFAQTVCKDSLPTSLLLNPSFEDYDACNPNWRGEGGLVDGNSPVVEIKIPFWHPENNWQFIRYYNYDCRRPVGSIFDLDYSILDTGFPGIPLPIPHGKGLISIEQYNIGVTGSLPENKTNKKYITACLPAPMESGRNYGLAFDFGFGRFNPNFNDVTGFWAAPSPFSVGVFGRIDCPVLPINRSSDSSVGCLSDRSGWISLGEITLRGKAEWIRGYIEFTAPSNISTIGIGPSCAYNGNIKDTFALYYMDNIILSPKENFAFASIKALSGDACNGHYVLKAPDYSNAVYQWYKNKNIIPQAVGQTYAVPDTTGADGNYSVSISLPGECFTSLPYKIEFSPVRDLTLGKNRTVCDSLTLTLNAGLTGIENYKWQDGSGLPSFTAMKSGSYSVTATDQTGCTKTAGVNIVFNSCSSCKLYLPSAFTPNHDGVNDIFRPKGFCQDVPMLFYHLIVYNRWGQQVFSASDPASGWDGNYHGSNSSPDVYVYLLEYSFLPGKKIRSSATVLLMR